MANFLRPYQTECVAKVKNFLQKSSKGGDNRFMVIKSTVEK